jgi:hypothetical protein
MIPKPDVYRDTAPTALRQSRTFTFSGQRPKAEIVQLSAATIVQQKTGEPM